MKRKKKKKKKRDVLTEKQKGIGVGTSGEREAGREEGQKRGKLSASLLATSKLFLQGPLNVCVPFYSLGLSHFFLLYDSTVVAVGKGFDFVREGDV